MNNRALRIAAADWASRLIAGRGFTPDEAGRHYDELCLAFIAGAEWANRQPDPLGEALNSGTGEYRP